MATHLDCDEAMDLSVAVEMSHEDICALATNGRICVARATITSEVAMELLDSNNSRNRSVRKSQMEFLNGQLRNGKFVFNGETIVFGDDGNINNGQHRLRSCAETGVPIDVLLCFGVPVERFTTYDQSSRRTPGDVLSIEGHPNAIRLSATLRHIDNYYAGGMGKAHANSDRTIRGDNSYVLELLQKYPGADACVKRCAGFPRYTKATLAAALYWLFSQEDTQAAEQFFKIVEDTTQAGEAHDPVMFAAATKLRKWLTTNALGSRKSPSNVVANIWIKGWNAYRTAAIPKIYLYRDDEGQILVR
jgi:hypothetical protein